MRGSHTERCVARGILPRARIQCLADGTGGPEKRHVGKEWLPALVHFAQRTDVDANSKIIALTVINALLEGCPDNRSVVRGMPGADHALCVAWLRI